MEHQSNFYPLATTGHSPIASELIKIKNNRTVTTTLDVAAMFERRHNNVLRDVKNLECSDEFRHLNYEEREYQDGGGRTYPIIEMSKDGFTILAMGYKGKKAMQFKEAYIAAFNYMEDLLHQQSRQAQQLAERIDARLDRLEKVINRVHIGFTRYSEVSAFVLACCVSGHTGMAVEKDAAYQAYCRFCRATGREPENKSHFCGKVYCGVKGAYASTLTRHGKRVPAIRGLDLLPDHDQIIEGLARQHKDKMRRELEARKARYLDIQWRLNPAVPAQGNGGCHGIQ